LSLKINLIFCQDFRDLTLIEMTIDEKSVVNKIEHYTIDSKVKEDVELRKIVDFYLSKGEQGLDKVLTRMNCDLDGRFTSVSIFSLLCLNLNFDNFNNSFINVSRYELQKQIWET